MSTLQRRARAALAAQLREQLGPGAMHEDGVHALRLRDALGGTLDAGDVAWVLAALQRGAKGELRPTRAGAVPVHAAWSSTALTAAAFAPWRRDPSLLVVAGLDGFESVRLEERLPIPHGGGTPNLDVALRSEGRLVGIEAKLTEHLAPRRARPWRPAYRRPAMLAELHGGWHDVFADLLAGRLEPRYLDAGQLVRHALSLQPAAAELETHLVLLHWEPAGGDAHPEVREHREEVAQLLERVGRDASPRLHALSYRELLAAWEPARPDHAGALRARYDVSVT